MKNTPRNMTKTAMAATVLLLVIWNACGMTGTASAEPEIQMQPASAVKVVISEFLYDPLGPELEGEFIELRNIGDEVVNLDNWTLSDQDGGTDFIFPDAEIAAGGSAVIRAGPGNSSYSIEEKCHYYYMNKSSSFLSAAGDDILLCDASGQAIDFTAYGNGTSVDLPPPDFGEFQPLSFIDEGFSYTINNGIWSPTLPTPGIVAPDISGILIAAACPDATNSGEFIRLANLLNHTVNIGCAAVTDLEGMAIFPKSAVIAPGQTITVAENGTRYFEMTMTEPEYSYYGIASCGNMHIPGSQPRFTNSGDEILLVDTGLEIVDAFVYGGVNWTVGGWTGRPVNVEYSYQVIERLESNGQFLDTNTCEDWNELKITKAGQSSHAVSEFRVLGETRAFVSPDCSMSVIQDAIANASETINLNVYEFTNYDLASALRDAMSRGVVVRILVDGTPVGGMPDDEISILSWLADAGADIHLQNPKSTKNARYRYNHGKYLTLDNRTTIVMTENWKNSGVPGPGRPGNRGWGISIENCELARYYSDIFFGDWSPVWPDIGEFEANATCGFPEPFTTNKTFDPVFPPQTASQCIAYPVIYPDMGLTSEDPIINMLACAENQVLVEQFYIDLHWGEKDETGNKTDENPYLMAVVDAARRGCEVRVLMDSSDYNRQFEDYNDNDDTAEFLNNLAAVENLDLEAKLARPKLHSFYKIHTKGLVVDSSKTLISSINWNDNSCTRNREVGIIVDSPDIGRFFSEVFAHDWKEGFTQPVPIIEASGIFRTGQVISFTATNSTSDHEIEKMKWDFDGDGLEDSNQTNASFVYSMPGLYNVSLEITDIWGNTNCTTLAIEILDADAQESKEAPRRLTSAEPDDEKTSGQLSEKSVKSPDYFSLIIIMFPLVLLALSGLRRKRR